MTPNPLPLLTSSGLYGRASIPIKRVGLFGQVSKPAGVRSTYHEPQSANQQLMNKSMNSGVSGGSAKIGFLMKSLDGGALFSRHALINQQKSPLDRSHASSHGYEGIGQQMVFKNQ